jgi:YidC/Oxa1 family membrane protein insertase
MFDPLFDGLAWLLNFFYTLIPSYGAAIILLTIAVYSVAFPLTAKSTRSMAGMAKLQPELQKIKQRYPDDRQKQSEETFALMREHGTSPFGGCLPLLVQMPVFFIMYQLLYNLTRKGEGGAFNPKYLADDSMLRTALENADGKMVSFGLDLAKTASEVLTANFLSAVPFLLMIAALVGTGYFQQYQISRRNPQQQNVDNPYAQQMQRITKIMPLMYLFFGFTVPAGVVLYLLVSNSFRIVQQTLIYRFDPSLRAPVGAKLHESPEIDKDSKEGEKAPPAPKPAADKSGGNGKGTAKGAPKGSPNGPRRPPGRAQPKRSKKKGR